MRRNRSLALLLLLLVMATTVAVFTDSQRQVTAATTFAVDSTVDEVDVSPGDGVCDQGTGSCTLRAAIMEANALPGADTVEIPSGTYTLTLAGTDENGGATGDLDITEDLTIAGAGAGVTIVDGNSIDRVFHVVGSANVEIHDLTITGGEAETGGGIHTEYDLAIFDSIFGGNLATFRGGGVFSDSPGLLTITRTVFTGNSADAAGGGLYAVGGTLEVSESAFTDNEAPFDAAGLVAINGTGPELIEVTNSDFTGNIGRGLFIVAQDGVLQDLEIHDNTGGGAGAWAVGNGLVDATRLNVTGNTNVSNGGGLQFSSSFPSSEVHLSSSTVSDNSAWYGAGIDNSALLTVTDTVISGNTAETIYGGGLFNANEFVLNNVEITGNSAPNDDGGGIWSTGAATINNSTISGNGANNGGGIYNSAGPMTITATTITDNTSTSRGGGIHNIDGPVNLLNTIVAGNTAPDGPDIFGSVISLGHNLLGDDTDATGSIDGLNGDIVGTGGSPVDPELGPLADNGGPTQTHALLPGSPVIDAGDSSVIGPPLNLATDQRGLSRLSGAAVDIGAFESQSAPVKLDDQVKILGFETTYDPTPVNGAPSGIYSVTGFGKNVSQYSFKDLTITVEEITGGNLVLGCKSGVPQGPGCSIQVPESALGADGVLDPEEQVALTVQIALVERPPFSVKLQGWAVLVAEEPEPVPDGQIRLTDNVVLTEDGDLISSEGWREDSVVTSLEYNLIEFSQRDVTDIADDELMALADRLADELGDICVQRDGVLLINIGDVNCFADSSGPGNIAIAVGAGSNAEAWGGRNNIAIATEGSRVTAFGDDERGIGIRGSDVIASAGASRRLR